MFKQILISTLFIFLISPFYAQKNINTNNIEIIRDQYGVPHIFTKTNTEAVYGIAWAQCEDNFHMIQDNIAATKGMAGRLMGKNGAVLDFLYEIFEIADFVERRYEQDISPEMEELLATYIDAINQYATTHPEEVKTQTLFPLTIKEILGGHILQLFLLQNSALEIGKLLTKDYEYALMEQAGNGSNAMAFSPNITADGNTYLIGNPHQPVNKKGNFWEVSVHSEEGYEMFGATFAVGGLFPILGANRHLGWSHTINYQNTGDVYQLEMHPTKKDLYKYDGEWLPLEVKKARLKVKIGALVLPVTRKYYRSKYGPTFKKKSGYYSYKSNVLYNLKIIEQWYKMGSAKNMDEFMDAMNLQGLTGQTTTYADKEGNIYHISLSHHPMRNERYDWNVVLPGNTSAVNWNLETIHPISALPQIKNPKSGYLYDCNNTVFRMTAPDENLNPEDFPKSFGLLTSNTLRANTFEKLIKNYEKITFEQARKIREDLSIDKEKMSFRNCMNCDDIPMIINKHPQLSDYKKVYDKWDGTFTIDNKQASLMMLTAMYFEVYIEAQVGNVEKDMPEEEIIAAILKAQKFMMKHYGTLEVELGKIQKAVRHDIELPMYGGPNTLANTHVKPYKKGKVKIVGGDSFIFYAKFGENGLETLQTINAFGNSNKEGHPHSTDQTEMYVNMQTKNVELDLEKLRAKREGYHPE